MAVGARDDAELVELVLAFGYATQQSGRDAVRRHIATVRAVAIYDQRTGSVTIQPDPQMSELVLEEDMLDVGDRVAPAIALTVGQLLARARGFEGDATADAAAADTTADATSGDIGHDISDDIGSEPEPQPYPGTTGLAALHEALETWTQAAGPEARYLPTVARHAPRYGRSPAVSFAPALILRRRGTRATVQALRSISGAIQATGTASGLLEFLIDPAAGRPAPTGDPLTDRGRAGAAGTTPPPTRSTSPSRPTPSRPRSPAGSATNALVVVQGPPGTGKTHTIANLVTDLLAHGKRVLITSHTARALQVLRDKLPEELRPAVRQPYRRRRARATGTRALDQGHPHPARRLRPGSFGRRDQALDRSAARGPGPAGRRAAGSAHRPRDGYVRLLRRHRRLHRHARPDRRAAAAEEPALGWIGTVPEPAVEILGHPRRPPSYGPPGASSAL